MARRLVALMFPLFLVIVGLIALWYFGSQKMIRVEMIAAFMRVSYAEWGG